MISCVSGRWKKNSTDRWDHMDTVLTVAMIHLPGSLAQAFSSSVILFSNPDHMERLFLYAVIFFLALRAPQVTECLVSIIYPIPNAKQLKHFLIENFLSVKNWRIKLINRYSLSSAG